MQPAYVLIIVMLHAAFGCMFLFASWQGAGRFSRLLAQSWLLEAFRACIVLMELDHPGGSISHWHSFSDCLNLLTTWWLLAGCADLVGVRLPARLGPLTLGLGVPVILGLRYLAPGWLEAGLGVAPARAWFLGTVLELSVLFCAVAAARLVVLAWLFRLWRTTRRPGALLALVFSVPFMVFAIAVPVQYYFGYYPEWIYLGWVARILGFSLGMVMLLFDRQLAQQRDREEAYRTLVETSHDLIWAVDAAGRWTYVNAAARRIFGYEPAEMLGRPFTYFQAPEQAEKDLQTFAAIKAGTVFANYETVHRRKDGTPVHLSFNASVLTDAAGHVTGLSGSAQDITRRKLADAALRESEMKFHAVFAQSPLAIVLTTLPEGRVADANPAAEQLLGYTLPEVLGRTTTDLGIWASPAARDQYLQKLRTEGRVNGDEARIRTKAGREIDVLFHGRVIQIGGQSYVLNSLVDITERRKAEELARHLAAFPELNPNPVLEFSREGALAYQNPAAVAMALKLGFADIEHLCPAETAAIVADCLAHGRPRLRYETSHGRSKLSWSFYPIAGRQVVHCYVGDITDRQSLEEQLRQAQKMEAIGQLAGGVAHDFNNMLTAIIGHLGLLRDNPQVTPGIDESLGEIAAAANRAARLTSQLLAFSRRQVLSPIALDLNEVVTHLTKMLRRILGEHVIMQLDFAPGPLVFHGDAGLMEQVLINLAVNARDAMPGGGTLRIMTRSLRRAPPASPEQPAPRPDDYVRLSVSDTGTGIPPEIRDRLFEPFFTTKEVGKGTGLGLATAFGIVQQHQGWIEVESEPGQGARFHVFLPRLAQAPAPPSVPLPAEVPRGRDELVLLVEDEPSVQEMGAAALRRQGYRVLTADNGRAALQLWAEHQAGIDLLLTDMIMPDGISGAQLARQLLADKPSLRVVYTSGYNADIAGKELKLTDGVNYLAKPYELERLFRTVRNALDGPHSRPPFGG